jgi:hypothetical protein
VKYTSWHGHTNHNLFCFISHSADGNVKVTRHVTRDIIDRIPHWYCCLGEAAAMDSE